MLVVLQIWDQEKQKTIEMKMIFVIENKLKFQPINAYSSYWPFGLPFHLPNFNT
jgi:hypothetical protein